MKVSVAVPTTSIGRLGTLLRSLKRQGLKPWEVIVVAKVIEPKLIESSLSTLLQISHCQAP